MNILYVIIMYLVALCSISVIYNIFNYIIISRGSNVPKYWNVVNIIFISLMYVIGIMLALYVGYKLILTLKYIPFDKFM